VSDYFAKDVLNVNDERWTPSQQDAIYSLSDASGNFLVDTIISGGAFGIIKGAKNVGKANETYTNSINTDTLLKEAGQELDKGGLTKAGRALQKHGDREGSVFPEVTGNVASKNQQGQKILEEILNSKNKEIKDNRFGGGKDIYDKNTGRGVRFDSDNKMKGFLEP